jgi:pimeloyl-ACP methyl ester carboxylesterase
MDRVARMGASLNEATKHYLFMILAVVLSFGCTDDRLVYPDLRQAGNPTSVQPTAAELPSGPQAVEGEFGPGAKYGLYLPESWNGDLVLFAPGYCVEIFGCPEGELPTYESPFRDALLAQGYAVAWTGYSEGGYVVKEGAPQVAHLKSLFTSRFTKPEHTYLYGLSMGGAIVMQLAESRPELFDGVITDSGVIAGVLFHWDYFFNCRVLFDYFFPGILPEGFISLDVYSTDVFPQMVAAMQANPSLAEEMAGVDQIEMQYDSLDELLETVMLGVGYGSVDYFIDDLLSRTHDRPFFDNSEVYYTGSTDDAALNAAVERVADGRGGRNIIRRWYDPTGNLRIPVLALHARRDPNVPVFYVTTYGDLAADAGASDMFVQRIVDMFGHAAFDTATRVTAVQDLDAWVTTGVRPTP